MVLHTVYLLIVQLPSEDFRGHPVGGAHDGQRLLPHTVTAIQEVKTKEKKRSLILGVCVQLCHVYVFMCHSDISIANS